MLRSRRTNRLLTLAAGATFILAISGAGAASAFDAPDFPEVGFPQVTFDPCLINPQSCDPGPTVPDGPDDFTDNPTTPTTVAPPEDDTPDPTVPSDDTPVVPTAEPAPVVVAAPHFTG